LISVISLAFLLCLTGCTEYEKHTGQHDSNFERKLCISLLTTNDYTVGCTFSADELNNNFSHELIYKNVYDVTIEINGKATKLEDALDSGLITEDDIFYYAKLDARAGFCQYVAESINGVTSNFFYYPDFNLQLICDVLEAPDGEQHKISSMLLTPPDSPLYPQYIFYDENEIRYDIENWGLNFIVKSSSSTSITIETTQNEGQQIGQLGIVNYIVGTKDGFCKRIDDNPTHATFYNSMLPLTMNGSGLITIDWSKYYGTLPSGDYEIILYIRDFYDSTKVHPLMRDYMDYWPYKIEFKI